MVIYQESLHDARSTKCSIYQYFSNNINVFLHKIGYKLSILPLRIIKCSFNTVYVRYEQNFFVLRQYYSLGLLWLPSGNVSFKNPLGRKRNGPSVSPTTESISGTPV
jgi:hypothetical protein